MFHGAWLIFGIVLLPVYGVLLGWILGKPRNFRVVFLGLGYLVGITVLMWTGLAALAGLLSLVFF